MKRELDINKHVWLKLNINNSDGRIQEFQGIMAKKKFVPNSWKFQSILRKCRGQHISFCKYNCSISNKNVDIE